MKFKHGQIYDAKSCTILFFVFILGTLDAPYDIKVVLSTSLILSWGAPFSLNVTGYDPDIFYYTLCTIYGCKTIPSDPDCTFPKTCTSSVDFTDSSLTITNKTIMDNDDPIQFTFAAINGAGKGNMTNFTYCSTKVSGLCFSFHLCIMYMCTCNCLYMPAKIHLWCINWAITNNSIVVELVYTEYFIISSYMHCNFVQFCYMLTIYVSKLVKILNVFYRTGLSWVVARSYSHI